MWLAVPTLHRLGTGRQVEDRDVCGTQAGRERDIHAPRAGAVGDVGAGAVGGTREMRENAEKVL